MDSTDHYFTAEPASSGDRRLLEVALAGRRVSVEVAPGIFSPGGVDKGTRVLLETVPPPPPTGTFLDLGCGWGPIALTLRMLAPSATVWAVDVNERALDLARLNAASLGLDGLHATTPDHVPATVRFDLIWSNPPIRIGKDALHALLLAWLPRLAPSGSAYLVVQKNLGGDSLRDWLAGTLDRDAFTVTRHATAKGFRVLHVARVGVREG